MSVSEKVAYLRGLMEGLDIDDDSKEGKLFAAIVDALDEMASEISDLEEDIEDIDDDLDELEERIRKLEEDPEQIDRNELLRLNAELDAILEKILKNFIKYFAKKHKAKMECGSKDFILMEN